MLDPVTTNKLAQIRYNEMLTEAQVARRGKNHQPVATIVRTALSRLGSLAVKLTTLATIGQKVEANPAIAEAEANPIA